MTTLLIPLFAVGLFASFTLSQAGMVVHHWRLREAAWPRKLALNAVGTITTATVLVVVVVSKFTEGAWIPTAVIPLIVVAFMRIHRHYADLARAAALPPGSTAVGIRHTVVVLVGRLHRGVPVALAYAKSLRPQHLVAVTVATDDVPVDQARADWDAHDFDVPLEIVESPYRDLTEPLLAFLDELDARWDDDTITVVIPEIVVHRWYQHVLHNQSALALKARLLYRDNTVVTSVPWQYDHADAERRHEEQVVTVPPAEASAAPEPAPVSADEPPAGDEGQVE